MKESIFEKNKPNWSYEEISREIKILDIFITR